MTQRRVVDGLVPGELHSFSFGGKFDGHSLAFGVLETSEVDGPPFTTAKVVERPCGRVLRHLREHQSTFHRKPMGERPG